MFKKSTLLLLLGMISWSTYAQDLLSTNPEKKFVVLEEYTGVNCGFCPDGHRIANEIKDANSNTILVNIHAGSFANPSAGQPDFRTPYGNNLANEMGVSGYPSGTINRTIFGGELALSRTAWLNAAVETYETDAAVNIGAESSYDPATRELTVTVAYYYTQDGPGEENFLQIAFLENGYIGFQVDYGNGNNPNYEHNHILRELITGQWGEAITDNQAGQGETRTYTYVVPDEYDIDNCELAVYITESRRNVINGRRIDANGGTTVITSTLASKDASTYYEIPQGGEKSVEFEITNNLPDAEMYTVELDANIPSDWAASMTVDGNVLNNGDGVELAAGESKTVTLVMKGSDQPNIASAGLTVSSTTYDKAPVSSSSASFISGVTDVVLSTDGAKVYEVNYNTALQLAGNNGYASMTEDQLVGFSRGNAMNAVNNIYYNIGWTFPGLKDRVVTELESFLDAGGNLFIAGQDIGWDAFDAAGNGTVQTRAFYNNYMGANYLSDGAPTTTTVRPETADDYFKYGGQHTFINVYGNSQNVYVYPEELSLRGDAQAIYRYGTGTKIGGVRNEANNFKVVYLGFNIEQFADIEEAMKMLILSHDYFYGILSDITDVELEEVTVSPNPASDYINVKAESLTAQSTYEIRNLSGQLIQKANVGSGSIAINTLADGMHFISLRDEKGMLIGLEKFMKVK